MIQVYLFDRFRVECGETPVRLSARKAQELFAFLLLHPQRSLVRELVASRLWGETCTTAKSRAYLRKALWKLQRSLREASLRKAEHGKPVIATEGNTVAIGGWDCLWADVRAFEQTYDAVRDLQGSALSRPEARQIGAAIDLYTGDLLEDWFAEWCVVPRARLKQMYLMLLDKLLAWAVSTREYETGQEAAQRILAVDRARERTHRQLMRLYAGTGRRSEALRQFEACETALEDELGVAPGPKTTDLVQNIRAGQPAPHGNGTSVGPPALPPDPAAAPEEIRPLLEHLCCRVDALERQVHRLVQLLQSDDTPPRNVRGHNEGTAA
jgi:DNA-binding SARP family transcriptional activator